MTSAVKHRNKIQEVERQHVPLNIAELKRDWLASWPKNRDPLPYRQLVPGRLNSGADWCLLRITAASFLCPPAGHSAPGGTWDCGAFRDSHPCSDFLGEVSGSKLTDGGCWGAGVRARQTSPTLSWRHWRPQRRAVLWGLQDDQPCPRTKNGYST